MAFRADGDGVGVRSRAIAAMTKDTSMAYVLLDREGRPVWAAPSLFTMIDIDMTATDPWAAAMHPDDQALSGRVLAQELVGPADQTFSVGRRFEQIVRMRSPEGVWRRFALHLLNLVDDPEVEGYLLQVSAANQELSTVVAFDLAARGADAGEVVGALLETLESGGTGRSVAALFDVSGRCIGASPSAPIAAGDHADDPRWVCAVDGRRDMTLPVVSQRTNEHLGVLETCSNFPDLRPFTEALTHSVAQRVALVLDGENSRRELLRNADVDALTGLANRRAFRDALRNLEPDTNLTVVFIDVNEFKKVNDRYGHECGDAVLVEIARRLASVARPDDLVARIGGDEFVLVRVGSNIPVMGAHGSTDASCPDVTALGDHLSLITLEETPGLMVSCSVGVAAGPASARSTLLAEADGNMYLSKRSLECVAGAIG